MASTAPSSTLTLPVLRSSAVTVTETLFTPAEAEVITMVDVRLQREWRRHGYLPSHAKHARFDLFSLAHLTAMLLLAQRTGPLLAKSIATDASLGIASHVLKWPDAYEGDLQIVGAWDVEAFERGERIGTRTRPVRDRLLSGDGSATTLLAEAQQIVREEGGRGFDKIGWLRANILHARDVPPNDRFLIWWADATHCFTNDLNAAFNSGVSSDPRFNGAPMVLDLDALASGVIARAQGRAFFHVEIEDGR
jgi:hypothetical protein